MHDLSQTFNQATDLHRKGNLAAAEGLYLKVIAAQPTHFGGRCKCSVFCDTNKAGLLRHYR
jgi:hypothetical protein